MIHKINKRLPTLLCRATSYYYITLKRLFYKVCRPRVLRYSIRNSGRSV